MLIKEYRITLPLTVEEYEVGQIYSYLQSCKNETGGGEGLEIIHDEEFHNYPLLKNKFSSGRYTYRIYHLVHRVPKLLALLSPKGKLEIHEKAWNAYPYCRSILSIPKSFLKDKFELMIESYFLPGRGDRYNVHNLSEEKLEIREIIDIDIANDPIWCGDYKEDEDPKIFKSVKTGRGPLRGNWKRNVSPVMTCYKLVTVDLKWFLFQHKIENFIQKGERRIFTVFHRQVFCWIDQWIDLTLEDIEDIEEEAKEKLDKQRHFGKIRERELDLD